MYSLPLKPLIFEITILNNIAFSLVDSPRKFSQGSQRQDIDRSSEEYAICQILTCCIFPKPKFHRYYQKPVHLLSTELVQCSPNRTQRCKPVGIDTQGGSAICYRVEFLNAFHDILGFWTFWRKIQHSSQTIHFDTVSNSDTSRRSG